MRLSDEEAYASNIRRAKLSQELNKAIMKAYNDTHEELDSSEVVEVILDTGLIWARELRQFLIERIAEEEDIPEEMEEEKHEINKAVSTKTTHLYVSTYCQHDLHANCRLTCKICNNHCLCRCHE